jgi:hypothetical protein
MTKHILVARDFGCCTTMCNQCATNLWWKKKDFLSVFFGQNLVCNKTNQEN